MKCPRPLPDELLHRLSEMGNYLAEVPWRPRPSESVLRDWDRILRDWVASPEMPLLIRRGGLGRGSVLTHKSGRKLVPTDNTPAHWAFSLALEGTVPAVSEEVLEQIPMAMALKRVEREKAIYAKSGRKALLNEKGWKLCHIDAVNLGRGEVTDMPAQQLEAHFRRFLAPSNMFLVPLELSGLGEVEIIISSVKRSLDTVAEHVEEEDKAGI